MSSCPEIDLDAAKKILDEGSAIVVDIRDPGSYAEGHIPGARPLDNGNIQDFLDSTARDQPIIVCCYHGNSSKGATLFLLEQGFETAHSLRGGFEAWRQIHDSESGTPA